MNQNPWEAVVARALTVIGMADNKAWICIGITLCLIAALVRMMMTHADKLPRSAWLFGLASILMMGIGVALGVTVTYARGALVNVARGPGIVDFRRGGHLIPNDAEFELRAKGASPQQIEQEYRQLARDYFKIAGAKYWWLTLCQATSVVGWLLAGLSVMFTLKSVRASAKNPPPGVEVSTVELRKAVKKVRRPARIPHSRDASLIMGSGNVLPDARPAVVGDNDTTSC